MTEPIPMALKETGVTRGGMLRLRFQVHPRDLSRLLSIPDIANVYVRGDGPPDAVQFANVVQVEYEVAE